MKDTESAQRSQDTMLKRAGVSLTPDEKIAITAVIHDAIYWKSVAVMVLGIVMLPSFLQNLGILLILVGGVMLFLAHLTQTYLILAATDKRIFIRSGYIYTDMIELRYKQVESVEVGMTPIGQMFGYGSVILSGTGQRRVVVPYVKDAVGFRRRMNDILVNQ